jgi:hypothetical protein
MDQTRNLEIPGSTLARRPGMTFQSLSKTLMSAQRQVTISVPRSALLAASPYAPLPSRRARLAGNPAAGARRVMPEFSCIHPIRPPSRTSLPLAETDWS